MKVELHPAATAELVAQHDFYEERLPKLGADLEAEVHRGLRQIVASPEAWKPWPDLPEVRTFVLERFPFVLPYWHDAERVVVLAVAHARRRPGYWKGRLRDVQR